MIALKFFASFHPPTYDQISVVFRDKGHQLSCYFSYVSFMAAELVIWGVVTQSDGPFGKTDFRASFLINLMQQIRSEGHHELP
jgi:hypothetical protein